MSCFLISLETSGNQQYVYSSNKLRDVVGASELIYRVGTSFADIAIGNAQLHKVKEIENANGDAVEVVIATSGKAVLLASSAETAKKFITEWSKLVTEHAPGLDALAVYSSLPIDMTAPIDNAEMGFITAFKDAGKNFSVLKGSRAFVPSRFQRIPVTAQCGFSGFPAERELSGNQPVSRITRAKIEARSSKEFKERMSNLFGEINNSTSIENGLEPLESLKWIAVVHADGNSLGQVFTSLDASVKRLDGVDTNGRNYVNRYRAFSNALDEISASAFRETVGEIFRGGAFAPIVPIVVGGDDLTVVMDGYNAIKFSKLFMEKFCEATGRRDAVSSILRANNGVPNGNTEVRLGMCAGVCVTKPHFPFSASYRLAEDLMQEAKKVKKIGSDCIAIDFHILYDSVATRVRDIREKLVNKEDEFSRTAKPYVVDFREHENSDSDKWKEVHNYKRFEDAVKALSTGKKDDKTVKSLPSSQAHAIRSSLCSEHLATQEAEWKYLMDKKDYVDFVNEWEKVAEDKKLYLDAGFSDAASPGAPIPRYYTYFLDALEAADFMKDSPEAGGQGDE
jgi:hypothetical protein